MIIYNKFSGMKIPEWQHPHQWNYSSADGGTPPLRMKISKRPRSERDINKNLCEWVIMYNKMRNHSPFHSCFLDPCMLTLEKPAPHLGY